MTKLSNLLTSGGLRIIDTQTYSSNDTWTKPAGAVLVRVVMCGGGGSGRRPAANAAASSGGGAAPMVEMTFPAAGLGPTESVVVGAGGAAVSVTATDGNAGGYSAFGKLEAAGGFGGTNTVSAAFSLWHPSIGAPSTVASRVGSGQPVPGGANTGDGQDGAIGIIGGAGGYVGANNSSVGKAGGASSRYRGAGLTSPANATSGTGGTSGGATGGNGGTGASGEIRIGLGGEGGGAGGGGSTTGGNGGAGGVPGGGGGAGGFGTTTSGDSGAGGAGQVYVETWG